MSHEDPKELPAGYYVKAARGLQGQSLTRDLVLEKVNSQGLNRPNHNLIRNNC